MQTVNYEYSYMGWDCQAARSFPYPHPLSRGIVNPMILLTLASLYVAYAGTSVFFIGRLRHAYKTLSMHQLVSEARFLDELPSVSVCISARNETNAMTECLESVIASRYPKLEIIVLDDDSRDNTSFLIKSFAHAGVRFVQGAPLPDGWLGKNYAYETLSKEASGSYVLYMDVDTKIAPDTIGQLVAYVQQNSLRMLSVMPMRMDGRRSSVVFSSLRYFWEIIFHTAEHPAAASAVWMIHRHTLQRELGGFAPIREIVRPEARLAWLLIASDAYRFLMSTPLLGVRFEKKWRSQCETARRLLLPKFQSIGGAAFGGAFLGLLTVSTFVPLLALVYGWSLIFTLFSLQTVLYMTLYASYTYRVWRRGWLLGFFVWPIVIVQECVLFAQSAIGYAKGTITWKGRPVRRQSLTEPK